MRYAHEGHAHETDTPPAVEPTPESEPLPAAPPATTTTETTPPPTAPAQTQAGIPVDALAGGGAVAGVIVLWLIATYILKLTLPIKIILVAGVLLVAGIAGYQIAPVTSIIALSTGLALALFTTLAQLSGTRRHRD